MQDQDPRAGWRALANFRSVIAGQGEQLDALAGRGEELRALALQADAAMEHAARLRALSAWAKEAEQTIREKDRLIELLWREKNAQTGEAERYAHRLERTLADKDRHLAEKDQHILVLEEAIRRIDRSLPARLYRGLRRIVRLGRPV